MSDNFYVAPAAITQQRFSISSPEEVKHVAKVLRYKPGDLLDIFNGTGRRFKAKIMAMAKDRIEGEIIEEYQENNETAVAITAACALLKREKFDWFIEKATELGVRTIVPLVTERTIIQPQHDRTSQKVGRWQKLALAACKQSQRSFIPVVKEPVDMARLFADQNHYNLIVVAAMEEKQTFISGLMALQDQLKNILVVIGPEGGLTPDELALAKEQGASLVSLGKRRLRAETAAIVAITGVLAGLREL